MAYMLQTDNEMRHSFPLHWTGTSPPSATLLRTRLSDVFRSLNCKPLKKQKKTLRVFFEVPCRVYLSKHPSVIQGHKLAFPGSWVHTWLFIFLFFCCRPPPLSPPPTVKPLSCTDMENIQAINASMPVQCQAVPQVETGGAPFKSHYSDKWHLARGEWTLPWAPRSSAGSWVWMTERCT